MFTTSDLSQPTNTNSPSIAIYPQEKPVFHVEASSDQRFEEVAATGEGGSNDGTRIQASALTGFIMTLVGAGIFTPIGWIGLALSIIGLVKIRRSPAIYRGQGFAVAGIIYFVFTVLLLIGIFFILGSWAALLPTP